MSRISARPYFTVDQYLKIERKSEERHEFLDGEIYAMAGEAGPHADISVNLVAMFCNQLKGKKCRARTKDTKVRSGPPPVGPNVSRGLYSYPDIVIICDDPDYHDGFRDIITNPKVIIEVLSPGTEFFDRGKKFERYQDWNPTLSDYILVDQFKPQIEHFTRKADGGWEYHRYTGLDAVVTVPTIECTLHLAEVYDRIEFGDH